MAAIVGWCAAAGTEASGRLLAQARAWYGAAPRNGGREGSITAVAVATVAEGGLWRLWRRTEASGHFILARWAPLPRAREPTRT